MTDADLTAIETELKITLPAEYRESMLARGAELLALTYRYNGEPRPFIGEELYLDPKTVALVNLSERPKNSGTGYAFPKWWKTFFLFGTNGGGDFYSLRLDNEPGVFLIGSDCGDEPTWTHDSLEDYIEARLAEYEPEVTFTPPPPPPTFYEAFKPAERKKYEARRFAVPRGAKKAMDAVVAAPDDLGTRLAVANAYETAGETAKANHIRARCAFDCQPPEPCIYPDAVELLEGIGVHARAASDELPPGFFHFHSMHDSWWSDDCDAMERGLPSLARPELVSHDDAASAAYVAERLPLLLDTTPVRGLDFEWHLPHHFGTILSVPEAAKLTRIKFDSRPQSDACCPVIQSLIASSIPKSLRRLDPSSVSNEDSGFALASAAFPSLQRFDTRYFQSAKAEKRIRAAGWFRQLRQHHGPATSAEAGESLADMPNLHSLVLWHPDESALAAMGTAGVFPALRRFMLLGSKLKSKTAKSLAKLRCPGLIELWIRNTRLTKAGIRTLLAGEWTNQLQVLTLEVKVPDEDLINVIADSPCAKHLRILRFAWCGFPRLAGTALCRPDRFPNLTTLELKYPYNADDPSRPEPAVKDTAQFLGTLQTPKLCSLRMAGCDLGERSQRALKRNPALAGVRKVGEC